MRKVTVEVMCIVGEQQEPQRIRFVSTAQSNDDLEIQVIIGDHTYTIPAEDLLTFARAIAPGK